MNAWEKQNMRNNQPPVTDYASMYREIMAEKKKQQMDDEKKQRRDKMFAAIGDGISALSNLYFTTKGAPNSYDPKQSMSERTREMYDKINKDREDRYQQNLNMAMQTAKADNDNKWALANFGDKQGRDKMADEWKDKEFEFKEKEAERAEKARQDAIATKREQDKQAQSNWEKTHDETVKHNRNMEGINRSRVNNSGGGSRYARSIATGNGHTMKIPHESWNQMNIGYVFNALPDEVKDLYMYKDILDKRKRPVYETVRDENGNTVYDMNGNPVKKKVRQKQKLSNDDMLHIIGQYIDSDDNVRNAWIEAGGEIDYNTTGTASAVNAQPGNANGGKPAPPSRRGNTGNANGGSKTAPWLNGY